MIRIDNKLTPQDLVGQVDKLFEISAERILRVEKNWDPSRGTPVFTRAGEYTSRGWTEWTQGFQYGSAILQFDATGDKTFLTIGRDNTINRMAAHLTHIGVHDHGFNNISTYGNLLRLMHEKRIGPDPWEMRFYELACKISGAVQASRWTDLPNGQGFIHSFNGPHSLFADTIRSLRALAVSEKLGHVLMGEQDCKIRLLERILCHAEATANFNVYFGRERDRYDIRGRVAHESIFNLKSGSYRCPSSQQGYSPFSTWTRGLAWVLLGFAEQLEFVASLPEESFATLSERFRDRDAIINRFLEAAEAVADFYIEQTPTDGIPYWDTGAPGLAKIDNYLEQPADPFNRYEPVDSSAAAICAQGLIRLGHFLKHNRGEGQGGNYFVAGLTVARSLFSEPYLSADPHHEGLILHSLYHYPSGWDYIPQGRKVPCGESSMWGDYHARELALLIKRLSSEERSYFTFFSI